jgi:hypothetical protein
MGSSGKSGSSGKPKDVYGRCAAALGHGPFDGITSLVIDKDILWSGNLTRQSSPGSATITLPGWGLYTIHWGTADQLTTSPILTPASTETTDDHPSYHKLAYWTYDGLFGQERYSPPEIETVGYRNPDQTIITGAAAELRDFQANPFCLLAELLTSEYCGLGMSASMLVASTWQASAEAMMANHELYYISTSLTTARSLKAWAAEIFELCDGFVRAHQQTGLVEAGFFTDPSTVNPDLLPLITSQDLIGDLEQQPEDIDSLKTTYVLTYRDRLNSFKELPIEHNDLAAFSLLGERRNDAKTSQLIVRENQARAHNTQRARRHGQLGSTHKANIRAARARNLRPGQRIRLDIDPEPGGAQLNQVVRIQSITRTVNGRATLQLENERTLAPIEGVAALTPGTPPPPPEVAPVLYARFFEAPIGLAETAYTIGLLASQPAPLATGYLLHYDNTAGGTFPQIGDSRAFALRARLNASIGSSSSGPFSVELLDPINREMLDDNPSDTAARDDTLLMLVLKIAVSGQITADGSDKAWIEVFSCSEFVSTAANVIDVTALRGRQGTIARDFALHDEVWFIRRRDLALVEHADFEAAAAATSNVYFKIQPATASDVRPLEDCAVRTFNFALNRDIPPADNPVTTSIEWRYRRATFVPDRPVGNNPANWTLTDPPGSDARWAAFAHREIATGNVLGEWSVPVRQEGQIISYGTTLPTSGMIEGDAFILDDGRSYKYLSGSWGPSYAPFIKTDGDNVITGLQKANGYDNAWVMLANIFQIWNGVSSEAAFEVISSLTFIRNALIRNAAITTAKIADLAVEMLKIGPNAVTIPLTDTRNGSTIYGTGVEVEVCSIDIYCPIDMPILCWYTVQQGYTGAANWGGSIRLDGGFITTRGGAAYTDAPSMQKTVMVTAGWHTVSAWWYGQNSNVSTNETELAIMGAAR